MWRTGSPGRIAGLLGLLAVLLAAVACGSAPGPASGTPSPSVAVRPGTGAPAPGSPGLATAVARRLLAGVVFPPGGRAVPAGSVPRQLRGPAQVTGSKRLVQRYDIRVVRQPAGWVLRFLRRHRPTGLIEAGSGSTGLIARPVDFLTWSQRHPAAGLYQAELVVGVLAAGHGRTFVRADAQVIWYPPRSRGEYLVPSRFRAVRLEATVLNPRTHVITRVITSRAVIASLARLLNSLPADPGLTFGCAAGTLEYRVTFVPAEAGQPSVVAVPGPCPTVGVTAGGASQPDLLGSGPVITRVRGLLHLGSLRAGRP